LGVGGLGEGVGGFVGFDRLASRLKKNLGGASAHPGLGGPDYGKNVIKMLLGEMRDRILGKKK